MSKQQESPDSLTTKETEDVPRRDFLRKLSGLGVGLTVGCVPNYHNPEKFVCEHGFTCDPDPGWSGDFLCFANGSTIFSCHRPINCNYENFECPQGDNQYYAYG
jgi:hypothetical protein